MTLRSWRAAGFENGIAAELEIDYAGRVAEPGKYVSLSLVSLTRALVGRQRFVAHALVYLRHVTALMEDVAQEMKRYQAWHLRDAKRRLAEKFSLADPSHRKLLVAYWSLRHKEAPCPVREDSVGYADVTKVVPLLHCSLMCAF